MEMDDKVQICKLVALAIMIDSQITDTEFDFLDKLMDNYGLNEEQRHSVRQRNFDDDPQELAKSLTDAGSKHELIKELASAVILDGELSPIEKNLIAKVAVTVGVSNEELDKILASITG